MGKNQHIEFSNFYASDADTTLYKQLLTAAEQANKKIEDEAKTDNKHLGWVTLPHDIDEAMLNQIEVIANRFQQTCDVVVVIGIGGSYLGTKAVIDALQPTPFQCSSNFPKIVYAGNNLSADYLSDLIDYIKEKQFGMVVVSKSGTTTEPAISFRILRQLLENKCGKEQAQKLIVTVTDSTQGALHTITNNEGYDTFPIAKNIGGRYSVLSPVGLVPIAMSGINIRELLQGARDAANNTSPQTETCNNIAVQYAAWRQAFYANGKKIEILANYNPKLNYISEWWKQLFAESEGKEHRGIFPTDAKFSTDLHSIGQWIQEGERTLFETVIQIKQANHSITIPFDENNIDGLNYLANKDIETVNTAACEGTMRAHASGDVPMLHFTLPTLSANHLGALLYTFERACAISGYMMGVNPFDQPGVEAYKKNLFHLLGKPGY